MGASQRHDDGGINKRIDINIERFKLPNSLANIFKNFRFMR